MFTRIEKGQIWQDKTGTYQVVVDWVMLPPPAGLVNKTQRVGLIGISDKEEYNVEASWLRKHYDLWIGGRHGKASN